MKSYRKSLSFSAVLFSLIFLFSCGSTPKIQNDVSPSSDISQNSTETKPGDDISHNDNDNSAAVESDNSSDSADKESQTENDSIETEAKISETSAEQRAVEEEIYAEKISEDELSADLALFEKEEQENSQPLPQPVNESESKKSQKTPEVTVLSADDADSDNANTDKTEIQAQSLSKSPAVTNNTKTNNASLSSASNTQSPSDSKNKESTASETKDTAQSSETATTGTESNIDIFKNPAVIIPSRSMKVKNNQYVDVVYPGNGWIYIGETETENRFRYFGRKLGTSDTTFTLRSVKPGKTLLHFYKNDVLTAQYIDDYLEIEVINENAKSNEKAKAPSYAEVVPPKPVRGVTQISPEGSISSTPEKNALKEKETEVKKSESNTAQNYQKHEKNSSSHESSSVQDDKNVKTIIQTTAENTQKSAQTVTSSVIPKKSEEKAENQTVSETQNINTNPSKSLLEQAKESLKNKKYELALAQIQAFLDSETKKIDEALYVQGQILEADSPVRNIKSAIDCYDALIKKYPASRWWQDANKRKIYLNRYYVNIW